MWSLLSFIQYLLISYFRMQYNNLTSIQYPSLDLLPHASRWKCGQTKKSTLPHHCGKVGFLKEKTGTYLFSQVVSNQLSSARQSLTSVFGMGTGGTSASSAPAKYASSLAFTYSLLLEGCTLKTEYYCELANGVPKDCGQALDLLVHAS